MDVGEPLHDTAAVRALDRAAIARGTPGFALMQRAAEAAFLAVRRHWPDARRVVVACGRGNNGADGFLLASLLRESGVQVWVHAAEAGASTSPDARRARQAWERHGPVLALARVGEHEVDLAVDALLGIGVTRAPEGDIALAIDALNALDAPVFALDVPSGLDADRGTTPGVAVRALRTTTFIANKPGLHTGAGPEFAGIVECDDLDVDATRVLGDEASRPELVPTRRTEFAEERERDADVAATFRTMGATSAPAPAARLLRAGALARWLRPRSRNAHKGHHGHVLCLGGDHGMGGAIGLCAEGALRAGAGWVSVATRAEHVAPLLAARPEAMTRAVESDDHLTALLERADVLALGPGLGQGEWSRALHAAALRAGKPIVIDADGLNLVAQVQTSTGDSHRPVPAGPPWGGNVVLTPHPGEAARLLGCTVQEIEGDRFAAARTLAETFDASVVLKGAGSIVAAPQRIPCVIGAGNPGMASAGMGDVLTGVIAALLAQGLEPFDAACAGALLHATAGDHVASHRGERGMLASDLFEHIQTCANPERSRIPARPRA